MKGVFEEEKLKLVAGYLATAKRVVISTHKSPDGDAVGSSLALGLYLKKIGIETVEVIVPDGYPDFLKWIPGQEMVLNHDHTPEKVEKAIENADLIFCLDYNIRYRAGKVGALLEAVDGPFVLIDHHQQPDNFAQAIFSDVTSCSTAQMIFQFIDARGDLELIDHAIGQGIYCGIMTDTGSFRFPSVNAETHQIAAWLIDSGMDHAAIHRAVYDTNSVGRLKLLGYALAEKLEVLADYNLAIISLTAEELEKYDYKSGDTEGLVNYALSIDGVNMAVFVREGNNGMRISFRSSGSFDVNQFARAHFSGGGHKNAAGGTFEGGVDETLAHLKSVIVAYKDQLNY